MKKEKLFLIKNLPENVIEESMNYVSCCSVALIGYSQTNKIVSDAVASGTLVSIKNKCGILTVKHVWDMFTGHKEVKNIHFSILEYRHFIAEPKNYLNPIIPDSQIDFCFLEIPPKLVNTIKSYRMFYPFKKENLPSIKKIKDNLWITFGFPEKMKSDEKKLVTPLRYLTNMVNYNRLNNGYHEIELIINYNDSNASKIPLTLGGMSGGGIWNFQIFYNDDDNPKYFLGDVLQTKLLVGVNYYQTELTDGDRNIIGVGPLTIYKNLYDYLV